MKRKRKDVALKLLVQKLKKYITVREVVNENISINFKILQHNLRAIKIKSGNNKNTRERIKYSAT